MVTAKCLRKPSPCLLRALRRSGACFVLLVIATSSGCHKATPSGPAFDLGAVVGQPYDAVKATLGAPISAPAPTDGTAQVTYKKGNYTLVVEYRVASGRIRSLTLTPNESVKDDDKAELLGAGNLKDGDARYTVDYVEDPNVIGRTSGLKITVPPQQHKVTMRVTCSTPQSVEVTYSAPSALDKDTQSGQPFNTVPPWYGDTSAPSETVLSMQAVPIRDFPNPNDDTTVQIEVDGKVAAQGKFERGRANCSLELN